MTYIHTTKIIHNYQKGNNTPSNITNLYSCRYKIITLLAQKRMISYSDFQHPKWKTFIIADESPTNGLCMLERKGFWQVYCKNPINRIRENLHANWQSAFSPFNFLPPSNS